MPDKNYRIVLSARLHAMLDRVAGQSQATLLRKIGIDNLPWIYSVYNWGRHVSQWAHTGPSLKVDENNRPSPNYSKRFPISWGALGATGPKGPEGPKRPKTPMGAHGRPWGPMGPMQPMGPKGLMGSMGPWTHGPLGDHGTSCNLLQVPSYFMQHRLS